MCRDYQLLEEPERTDSSAMAARHRPTEPSAVMKGSAPCPLSSVLATCYKAQEIQLV